MIHIDILCLRPNFEKMHALALDRIHPSLRSGSVVTGGGGESDGRPSWLHRASPDWIGAVAGIFHPLPIEMPMCDAEQTNNATRETHRKAAVPDVNQTGIFKLFALVIDERGRTWSGI